MVFTIFEGVYLGQYPFLTNFVTILGILSKNNVTNFHRLIKTSFYVKFSSLSNIHLEHFYYYIF